MIEPLQLESMKRRMLEAANTARAIAESPQTLYFDEEDYRRIRAGLAALPADLTVLFAEVDSLRGMFGEQVAGFLRAINREVPDEGPAVRTVADVSGGGVVQTGVGVGPQEPAGVAVGVPEGGTDAPRGEAEDQGSDAGGDSGPVQAVPGRVGRGNRKRKVGRKALDQGTER
jgi:hypothetical protein